MLEFNDRHNLRYFTDVILKIASLSMWRTEKLNSMEDNGTPSTSGKNVTLDALSGRQVEENP